MFIFKFAPTICDISNSSSPTSDIRQKLVRFYNIFHEYVASLSMEKFIIIMNHFNSCRDFSIFESNMLHMDILIENVACICCIITIFFSDGMAHGGIY